jgi:hypothetical protein
MKRNNMKNLTLNPKPYMEDCKKGIIKQAEECGM